MARKVDCNQSEIVSALRAAGATVQDLSQVGKGCPDLLIGYHGRNYLLEVKNAADRAPKLTPCEEEWIKAWRGQVGVITSVEDAIAILEETYEDEA